MDFLNPHYFVLHGKSCNAQQGTDKETKREMLGCKLKDFGGTYVGQGREAHWNLRPWTEGIDYVRRSRDDYSNVSVTFGQAYPMPDYCSRAIVSELSTVYSRGRRSNGAEHALSSNTGISSDCSWFTNATNDASEAKVFNPEPTGKACWNFVSDYRWVYCLGYSHCECDDSSDEACHMNDEKVQCCKDAYAERIEKLTSNLPPKLESSDDQKSAGLQGMTSGWTSRLG